MSDAIKPTHYRTANGKDLISQWSERYSNDEFRAVMSSHIDKYLYRDKENRVQDLNKAKYFLDRWIEKEQENEPNKHEK